MMITINLYQFILFLITFFVSADLILCGFLFKKMGLKQPGLIFIAKGSVISLLFWAVFVSVVLPPSSLRTIFIVGNCVLSVLGFIITPRISFARIISSGNHYVKEQAFQDRLDEISSFLKTMNATCMDISEDKIFNNPPDIYDGFYLTKIELSDCGLVFYGASWEDFEHTITLQEDEITLRGVNSICRFLQDNEDYIKIYATFS